VDGLDKAGTKDLRSYAKRSNFVAAQDSLLYRRIDCAVIDQGTAWMINKDAAIEMAGAELANLTSRTDDRALVALRTGLRVVNRPEAVGDLFAFVKDIAVSIERCLIGKSVRLVVEAC